MTAAQKLCRAKGQLSYLSRDIVPVQCHASYVTMTPKEVNERGDSPLFEILDRMGGISMAEFARRIGCSSDSVRSWVKGRRKHPSFTIPQWKRLMEELEAAKIPLSDFPDDFKEKT